MRSRIKSSALRAALAGLCMTAIALPLMPLALASLLLDGIAGILGWSADPIVGFLRRLYDRPFTAIDRYFRRDTATLEAERIAAQRKAWGQE